MYAPRVAWRYLLSRRIHLVGIAGIAVGVTALVVVLSVMNGFIQETRRAVRGSLADATVTPWPPDGRPLAPYEEYRRVLEGTPGVAALAPRLVWAALVSPGRGTNLLRSSSSASLRNGVRLVGVDPEDEARATSFGEFLRKPSIVGERVDDPARPFDAPLRHLEPSERDFPRPTLVVGEQVYDQLGLRKGQVLNLGTVIWDPETADYLPSNAHFTVAGTFRSGEYEYDLSTAFLDRAVLRDDFLEIDQDFSEIVVRFEDDRVADAALREIRSRLAASRLPGSFLDCEVHGVRPVDEAEEGAQGTVHGDRGGDGGRRCGARSRLDFHLVERWQDRQSVLLTAIDNEKKIMAVILFFIVLVAGFNLFATLSTMVAEKTRDLGVLAALGATRRGILGIFLLVGLGQAAIGEAIGLGAGLAIARNLPEIEAFLKEHLGLEIFNKEVYIFDHLPCEVDPLGVAATLAATFAAAFFFSAFPAMRAARLDPVRALRYE